MPTELTSSTATLNPASLHYCIPPGDSHPLYIPIVFNNSLPEQVSYFVRSLETGQAEVRTIKASHLKRHATSHHLAIEDEDAEDLPSPNMALMTRSSQNAVVKANSVKPAESLEFGPQEVAPTEHVLFLNVDKPAVVSLKSVVDARGDRFHISPHKEAVIIECPTGGHFVDEKNGQLIPISTKRQPAELRCQGDSEVVQFQARGVGALRVGWKKEKDGKDTAVVDEGIIEGIEEDVEIVDELALVRQDRLSRTHVVPLRVSHNTLGLFDISLTSVEDSMRNRYYPSDISARKTFNVIPRPSASFAADNRAPRELLIGRTTTLQVSLDGLSNEPAELVYSFKPDGQEAKVTTKKISKKTETITADQPGKYTLLEIKGPCGGLIKEPSTFAVQLVPKPTLEMQVTTLHEW
jgi:nucleoporin POM152